MMKTPRGRNRFKSLSKRCIPRERVCSDCEMEFGEEIASLNPQQTISNSQLF